MAEMLSRSVYINLVYPLFHRVRGDGVLRARRSLRESEWLDVIGFRELQRASLVNLLTHASQHVPYYRDILSQGGLSAEEWADSEAFQRLPILTKALIGAEGRRLVADDAPDRQLIANSTSGSTGTALRFFTDQRSLAHRKATVLRNQEWIGIEHGDRQVKLWGSPIDNRGARLLRGRIHGLVTRERMLSAYDLSEETMMRYAEMMRRFRPRLITAYPSALEVYARFCRDRDIRFPSLRAALLSAETLFPYQRDLFEEAFGIPAYNRYGCREVGDIAHECTAKSGLHLNSERIFLEILDDDGRPCGPGEPGEIVVTDLDNYGMPFIRYRMGDVGAWAPIAECQCGRAHPRLAYIEGRILDVIETPNGGRIGGTFWTILLKARPGVRHFQVVQREPGGIVIDYVPEGQGPDATALAYFRKEISRKCGDGFGVAFNAVGEIPVGAGGKRRYIRNELRGKPS